MVSTDSLVALWNDAWNNNDSTAIANLMTKDIDLMLGDNVLKGISEVSENFIGPNSKVIKNLKINKISSGSCTDQAYYYGKYTHDVLLKDSVKTGIEGSFSFIYLKEGDRWHIKVADIR